MIITRTPLRISFLGGGTDFKDFYQVQPGMVVSTAIDKYIYICIHKHFEGSSFLLKYSQTEEGSDVNQIKHPLLREAMKLTGVNGVEIAPMSDVPVTGIGLGSSSSFTVGLLNALYAYKGQIKTPEQLAEDACRIEIDILKNPIGKQDQYIAAFGNLRSFVFRENEEVETEKIDLTDEKKQELNSNLLLFYTGKSRESKSVLSEQKANIKNKMDSLIKVRDMAGRAEKYLNNSQLDEMGNLLHQNWTEKKQWAKNISDSEIDNYYQKAISAGALGGKISGAGGGGFLFFYCKKENQDKMRHALSDLKETKFNFEPEGSKIIYGQ